MNVKDFLKRIFKEKFLFFKMQSFITVIILLPIIITGNTFNSRFQTVLINYFSEANQNILKQTGVAFEMIVDSIVDGTKHVYFDEDVNRFLVNGDFNDYEEEKRILNKLSQIKSSNQYIHSVYLYVQKDNMIISTEYGKCKLEDFGDTQFLKWYKEDSKNMELAETHSVPQYKGSPQKDDVFSVYTKLPYTNTSNFRGALIVNIGQAYAYNEVIDKLKGKKDVSFFVLNKQDDIIISSDNKKIYQNIYSMNYFKEKMEGSNGSFVTNMNGSPYLVAYIHMGKMDWTYVYMYSMEEIYKTINTIKNLIVYLSILLFLLGVIVSVLFTLKTFKPVEELISFIKQKAQLKEDTSPHIGQVKDAVLGLFKDNEQMKQNLEMTVPVFKEKFLYGLVKGSGLKFEEIENQMNSFAIDIPLEGLILTAFQIDDYEETLAKWDKNNYIMTFSINSLIQHFFIKKDIRLFSVDVESDSIAVVIDTKDLKISELLTLLSDVQDAIYQNLSISMTIGVCDNETHVVSLPESYQKAREVLKYKILYGKKEILLYSYIHQDQEYKYAYPYEKVEFFKNYIKVCDVDNAIMALKGILECVPKNSATSYLHIYQMLIQLNNAIISLLNEVSIDLEVIYKNGNMIENVMHMKSMDEIEVFFESVIKKIIEVLLSTRESKIDKYFQKIVEYIKLNFMKDMTLESLSEGIHISPSYINQILKKNLDKTFIQILNEERVNKASEYLEGGDMKIKEIAEKVGFSSSAYFIKIFKEIKGVTPGQMKT